MSLCVGLRVANPPPQPLSAATPPSDATASKHIASSRLRRLPGMKQKPMSASTGEASGNVCASVTGLLLMVSVVVAGLLPGVRLAGLKVAV